MPLELQPATEADAERAAEIEREAYGPNEFSSVLFPGPFPDPVPGKNTRAEELAKAKREDPSIRWLKVVDTDLTPTEDNKQMVGFAQWNINDGSQLPPQPRVFHAGCNKEACEAVFSSLDEVRRKRSTGVKHVHLRFLHVDPKHQRRGAGAMLVNWGVEEARKLGLPAFLESSPAGHSLYLRQGFRDINIHSIDFTKWGKDANHITYIMALEA
ncbi:acyl-CoA N-acyltransferase [Xylaria bambusicola]|uniref:acyl-CoA N-acyltransferase n=1 Tax=Xylaria bambusicola TaxID=326684 RepID=UPI002008B6BF|nr:acyl-CoA N-acyltransferase [Xylaria bambusicola]KAI0506119.1 acyl-CoA N-acyltransferase [Xylaria bambusicola]